MKQHVEVFRESLSLFSTSALKKWVAIVIGTCVIFVFGIGGSGGGGTVGRLFGVAWYIGYLFTFGVPFIVGASFLICSQETQNNIVDSIQKGRTMRFARLFISYVVVTLFVMTVAVLIGFVFIIQYLLPLQILGYFLSILVSSLIVSFLVCPITVFLALTIDDWMNSTALGVLLFFAIALATGLPGYPVNYLEIAFLGPAHILTAIVFILIGGFTGTGYSVSYVGVVFSPIQLVIPLSLFMLIAVVFYLLSRWMFHSNLIRWTMERELWLSTKGGRWNSG